MNLTRSIIAAATLLASFIPAASKENSPNVLDLRESITDDAIVYPETFEANTRKLLEGWYLKNYTMTDDRYARMSDPDVSDADIRRRLAQMPTLIDMPFNQIVRSYIDRYTKRSRQQVAAILGLGTYYLPIFEQALEARGLPLELKYLPVIESGLDPNAVSRHGAAGLWQLMLGTGKGLGLEVNSLVDERRDPYMASEKAVGYLKELYDTYGDWSLAIAAYNCGPGAVNKAIRRAGGDPKHLDFWSIYRFLPEETRGYVPMFIAANYVMTYYPEHNISPVLTTKPLVTDTVGITSRLHFNQVAEVLNIPVNELRILNPQFRADIIPATPERPYHLILPSQQVQAYIVSEKEILAHDAEKYSRRETAEPGDMAFNANEAENVPEAPRSDLQREEESAAAPAKPRSRQQEQQRKQPGTETPRKTVIHKVAAGETLATIASTYGVEQAELKEWNNLRRNAVRTGQQLRVLVADNSVAPSKPAKETAKPAKETSKPAKDTAKAAKPAKQTAKPAKETATTAKTSKGKKGKAAAKPAKPAKPESHTVKSGDSLEKIARSNGTTVDELRKSNPNLKGDMIRPGDKINLPADSKAAKGGKNAKASKGSKSKNGKTSSAKKSSGKKSGKKR